MRTRAILTLAGMALLLSVAAVGSSPRCTGTRPRARPRGCAPLAPARTGITVEAGRMPVVVHIPPKLLTGAPLVLALPGAGQTARDFAAYTGYSRLADRRGLPGGLPTASGLAPVLERLRHAARGKPDDVAYLRAVIPAAVKAACADPVARRRDRRVQRRRDERADGL